MTTIERASEIARSGTVRTIGDIRQTLNREGFEGVQAHLNGNALQKQLRVLLSASRT
jgi:hypothetical protein